MDNGVEITALGQNCHFIQFITKQYSEDGETLSNLGPNYMVEKDTPRWAVDCVDRVKFDTKNTMSPSTFKMQFKSSPDDFNPPYSPYYEDGGAAFKGEDKLVMFDQPERSTEDERVIFATFLIENNQATKIILWSKEYINTHSEEPEMVYTCHGIKNIDAFPQWAIKAMQDQYQTNGVFKGFIDKQYLSMNFNDALAQILNKEPLLKSEDELRSLKDSFPQPPSNWASPLKDLYHQPTQMHEISSAARMMLMGVASTHPTPEIPEPEVIKDVKVEEEKKISPPTLSTPQTEQREDKSKNNDDEPKQGFPPPGY